MIQYMFFLLKVYQARLRANGQTVAVKVQRPGVRAAISLDIFILRLLAGFVRKAGKFNTDLEVCVQPVLINFLRGINVWDLNHYG